MHTSFFVAGSLLFGALSASGAETIEAYRPLLDNSPFLSQAFKDRLAKSEATGIHHYTFVGYTRIGENWKLCLIHKKTNLATWIEVDDAVAGYTLKAFSPENHTLSFEKNGVTATLTMEQPK